MNESLGGLFFRLGMDISGFRGELTEAEKQLRDSGERLVSVGKNIASALGVGLSIGGFIYMARDAVKEFREAERASLDLDQAYRSVGITLGFTREALDKLAISTAAVTRYDNDVIAGAEAILLRFRLTNEVFARALGLSLDLAESMGGGQGSVASAATSVGRALQDPISGLRALRSVGVNLSDAQEKVIKNLIETNDLAGAQRIVMDELATSVGGRATDAMNSAAAGTDKLTKSLNELKEVNGGAIAQMLGIIASPLERVVTAMTKYAEFSKSGTIFKWLGYGDIGHSKAAEMDALAGSYMAQQRAEQAERERQALEQINHYWDLWDAKYKADMAAEIALQKTFIEMQELTAKELEKVASAKKTYRSMESWDAELRHIDSDWQRVPDMIIVGADALEEFQREAMLAADATAMVADAFLQAAFAGERWLDVLLASIKRFVSQAIVEFLRLRVLESLLPNFFGSGGGGGQTYSQWSEGVSLGGVTAAPALVASPSVSAAPALIAPSSVSVAPAPAPTLVAPTSVTAAPSVVVQVIDNRESNAPPVKVEEQIGADGSRTVQLYIESAWREAYNRGKFDTDFARVHRLSRIGRVG